MITCGDPSERPASKHSPDCIKKLLPSIFVLLITLRVTWTPVPGAVSYRVYWGDAPGRYTNQFEVPSQWTAVAISRLSEFGTYFITTSAIHADRKETFFGGETKWTPLVTPQ